MSNISIYKEEDVPSIFDNSLEDYAWLDLPSIPEKVFNPLIDRMMYDEDVDEVEDLLKLMMSSDYIHYSAKLFLNVELPVYQCIILDMLWNKKLPMLIATRGAAKSFSLAVYCLLRMLFHPGCTIVIVGAGLRQSRQVFDYMSRIWDKAPVLKDIAGRGQTAGPRREVDRFQFEIGDSRTIALPIGDGCLSACHLTTYDDCFSTISRNSVKSEDGSKSITKTNLMVWGNAKFRPTDESYFNGKKPTKIIKTRCGYSFEGTHNHRMKVLRNDKIDWVRSDEMKVGDRILIDRSYRWHQGKMLESCEECYALGLMIGDGCWTQERRLGFATQDLEMVESLNKGGFISAFKQAADKVHWWMEGRDGRNAWLNKWGMEKCYAINKTLPKKILSAEREKMTACLRGLFDTDGSVQVALDKRGGCATTVSFWNTSEELVDQIHFILLHYGIVATKRSRQRENENWNREFSLQISGQDCVRFAKEIGFKLSRKQKMLSDGISQKVRDVSIKDCIPGVILKMAEIARVYGKKFSGNNRVAYGKILERKEASRKFVNMFLERYEHCGDPFIETLKELANPDIYYDTIVSIEDGECDTYDIHVPDGHEYCANGFFSHNSKIRGIRANYIIGDEFASIPQEIFDVVVQGFALVASDPIQKMKTAATVNKMKKEGLWTPEMELHSRLNKGGNQIVISGTAYYAFNHFYKRFQKWHTIISSKGDPYKLKEMLGEDEAIIKGFDWKDYAILRIPYTHVPEGILDPAIVAQAKASLSSSQFNMEMNACFVTDSDGFFKRSLLESATTNKPILKASGLVQFRADRKGVRDRSYVMGIDPAAEQDNAAIVIIEKHEDHRRIVYCWTTNRKSYAKLKKKLEEEGQEFEHDYYRHIAKKIRALMRVFNIERIVMDKNGGGISIMEALGSKETHYEGEEPVYEIINPEEEKNTDYLKGIHILQMLSPNQEINSDANHGMKKDFEEKTLLFPMFDAVELAQAIQIDEKNQLKYDTYEDLVFEIEEMKQEITTVIVTQSSVLGKETFDTPAVKSEGMKKGHLRKDRYSALLYANYYARNKDKNEPVKIDYKVVGGTRETIKKEFKSATGGMYRGTGVIKNPNNKWITGSGRFNGKRI